MFCEEAGTEHQLTTPYTPEQNGVSERRNRYIMDMGRCMLYERSCLKSFGKRQLIQQSFFKIEFQPSFWKTKHHWKSGMDINLHQTFLKCLTMCVLSIFHRSSMTNLTRKQFQVYLWDTVLSPKLTKCIIHKLKKLLS